MNSVKKNIADNLRHLRHASNMSQEEVAEKVGVSRQAVAKWEGGLALPDLVNCEALADLYGVSLNDLVRHDEQRDGLPIAPKHKHIFGTVTIGERGQMVLPKKARDTLGFHPGDTLVVLGDTNPASPGLALVGSDAFMRMTGLALDGILWRKEEEP